MADYNIALGVKQPEPVNYLGQMGQVLALKAAQDELQGSEATRAALAGGARDPYSLLQYGKQGRAAAESILKMQKDQRESQKFENEAVDKKLAISRELLAGIDPSSPNAAEQFLAWHQGNHSDPMIGPLLSRYGVTADQSRARIEEAMRDPTKLRAMIEEAKMGAPKFAERVMQDRAAMERTQVSTAPHWAQANLAERKFAWERENPTTEGVTTDQGMGRVITRGPKAGQIIPVVETPSAPPANALAPQGQTPTVMNAMNAGASGFTTVPPPVISPQTVVPSAAPAAPTLAPTPIAGGRARRAPTGEMAKYEPDPNKPGALRPIVGGPADPNTQAAQTTQKLSAKDLQAREAKYPVATQAVQTFEAKTDELLSDLERLRNHPGLNNITGLIGGTTPNFTGAARDAQALYKSIVARGGFNELQAMRNASPTGGALGNISNQEGQQLKDAFATLDQKQEYETFQNSLDTAITRLEGAKQRVRDAYDMTYEYRAAPKGATISNW